MAAIVDDLSARLDDANRHIEELRARFESQPLMLGAGGGGSDAVNAAVHDLQVCVVHVV